MLYDKDTINRNEELIHSLINIHKETHNEEFQVNLSLIELKSEKESALKDLEESKTHALQRINLEKETKLTEFKHKTAETEKVKTKFELILEEVNSVEEFMDDNFHSFRDNKERYTREKAEVTSTDVINNIDDLRQIHTKVSADVQRRSKFTEKSSGLFRKIQDSIINFKQDIELRDKLILLVILLIGVYKLVEFFMRQPNVSKVIYMGILVAIILGFRVMKKKLVKQGEYTSKDTIYKAYNLIDTIKKQSKLSILKIDVECKEKNAKAEQLLEKIRQRQEDELEADYENKQIELDDIYSSEIQVLELKKDLDLDHIKIELTIEDSEYTKEENMPVIADINIEGRRIPVYYRASHLAIIGTNVQDIMQSLATELILSEEVGRINIKLVDTVGLGMNFSDIIKLKDADSRIMGKEVYATEDKINEMLDKCIQKISDRIINILSKEHKNIFDYNKANDEKLNYEFIFISDIDAIQDTKVRQKLLKIIKQGSDWGIFVVMSGQELNPLYLIGNVDVIECIDQITLGTYNGKKIELPLIMPEYKDKLEKLHKALVSNTTKKTNFVELINKDIWGSDPSDQFDILIGEKTNGGLQNVKLGGSGINHHILLGGNTGSGKTSFIHTFILSACLKYSPELLELILIDFKQGVEFQVYADYKLPHARFLGLESDREYALNILKYLNAELIHRGDLCKQTATEDITSYNSKIKDTSKKMKRTIIIIDEFQELLRGQDEIETTTRALLDIITRLGRSFGIHLILSSQSLSGISGGLGGVENQIGTRVALRSSEDNSRSILSGNNTAAAGLTKIGQGIFNDNQGHINSNSQFTFGYIDSDERAELLTKIRDKADQEGYAPTTQIFLKSKLRHIDEVEWFDKEPGPLEHTNILLGESSALTKSYVDINLTRQSSENLLIMSKHSLTIDTLLETVKRSIYHTKRSEIDEINAQIIEIDAERVTDDGLVHEGNGIDHKRFGSRNAHIIISNIYDVLTERMSLGEVQHPIYFIIKNVARIRELQEDDYTSDTTAQMIKILREGPYYGIHVISTVDTYRSLEKTRAKILQESCHRLVGRMNDMDSSYVINDKRASVIDTDIEMIYYNDVTNEYDKVRLLKIGVS